MSPLLRSWRFYALIVLVAVGLAVFNFACLYGILKVAHALGLL